MAKTYISGETKAERKVRKAKDKEQRQQSAVTTPIEVDNTVLPKTSRFICCLKYGNKYDASYVNKLYKMVQKNCTLDYEFVCFTENAKGINENIRVEPLPTLPVVGWWFKPMFFNPDLGLKGTLLFLDLDMIIFRNIDKLFTYKPGEFCVIRDFNRYLIKNYDKFNSSVFRLNTGQHDQVYKDFIKNPKNITRRYHGDQDWIRKSIQSHYQYWPDEWIQSYKWEMRGKPRFDRQPRGQRDFESIGEPKIKDATSIAVFHGDPNPHNCKDPWVIKNWSDK